MSKFSWRAVFCSAVLACCCFSGCATLMVPWDNGKFVKASARNPVTQIVCLWEQAEGRDPDGLPCHGFAGQILFLGNRRATPVEIEGDVRIYLFDSVGTLEEQAKPLRQYDFTHDAWKIHLTKSALGPTYSVFVPYVRRGQHNAQCSLQLRLTPKHGPVIFSDLSSIPLRGPTVNPETTIISSPSSPEDRMQAEVNQALTRAMQKSSTIPLSVSNNGTLSIAPQSPSTKPAVETPADPMTDQRLSRMEQLLEGMLAQKTNKLPLADLAPSGIQQVNFETPASESNADAPVRFRLDRAEDDE